MYILAALVSYTPDTLRENLLTTLEVRSAGKRRALDLYMKRGKAWETPVIENPHGTNYFDMGLVNADYLANATTIVLKKDLATPMLVRVNQKIHFPATGETIFTSSTASDITETSTLITLDNVIRGIDGTAASDGTANDKVIVGSETLSENSQHNGSDHFTSIRQTYFTQIFKRNLEISGTTQAIEKMIANGDARFNDLVRRALDHLENVKLYQALFRGVHGASTTKKNTITGAAEDRNMCGVIDAIKRFNGITLDVAGALSTPVMDAQLAKVVNLDGPIEKELSEGGNPSGFGPSPYIGFVNATCKNRVNALEPNRVRREQKDIYLSNYIGTYAGPLPVDFVVVPPFCLFDDEMVIVRKDQYDLAPLNGRDFAVEQLGKTGDGGKWHVVGEMGGVLHYPETAIYLHGIT